MEDLAPKLYPTSNAKTEAWIGSLKKPKSEPTEAEKLRKKRRNAKRKLKQQDIKPRAAAGEKIVKQPTGSLGVSGILKNHRRALQRQAQGSSASEEVIQAAAGLATLSQEAHAGLTDQMNEELTLKAQFDTQRGRVTAEMAEAESSASDWEQSERGDLVEEPEDEEPEPEEWESGPMEGVKVSVEREEVDEEEDEEVIPTEDYGADDEDTVVHETKKGAKLLMQLSRRN